MVEIEDDHLGGATGGASALDGAGGAIADAKEAHHPRGLAATGERLVLGPDLREVGSGARAHLEEAGFPDPEVHDPARVDEVITDAIDEAGVGGGVGVGVGRLGHLAGRGVDVPKALGGAGDAIGMGETGVEPLRRVGRGDLVGEHVLHLVLVGLGVCGRSEVAVVLAPPAPGGGEAIEDLAARGLGAEHRVAVVVEDRVAVGVDLGHAGLAEILGDDDVGRHLRPGGRHLGVEHLEDDRAIGVGDAGIPSRPLDRRIGICAFGGVPTRNPQATSVIFVLLSRESWVPSAASERIRGPTLQVNDQSTGNSHQWTTICCGCLPPDHNLLGRIHDCNYKLVSGQGPS